VHDGNGDGAQKDDHQPWVGPDEQIPDDLAGLVGVDDRDKDHVGLAGHLGGRSERPGYPFQLLGRVGADVVDDWVPAAPSEADRHSPADHAETDHAGPQ
jgi:hypothetical protein